MSTDEIAEPSPAPVAGGATLTPVPVPVPVAAPLPTTMPSLPQKRALEDDHIPAVSSPLNPDTNVRKSTAPEETGVMAREKRTKKESLKKRESKAATNPAGVAESSRQTPDHKVLRKTLKNVPPAEMSPARYILPLPKSTDFEPARGPTLVNHHEVTGPDGERIEFLETTEQYVNKYGRTFWGGC